MNIITPTAIALGSKTLIFNPDETPTEWLEFPIVQSSCLLPPAECLLTLMIKKQPTLQQLKHRRNHYHSLLFTSKPQARPLIQTKIKQLTQQIQDLEAQLRKEL